MDFRDSRQKVLKRTLDEEQERIPSKRRKSYFDAGPEGSRRVGRGGYVTLFSVKMLARCHREGKNMRNLFPGGGGGGGVHKFH